MYEIKTQGCIPFKAQHLCVSHSVRTSVQWSSADTPIRRQNKRQMIYGDGWFWVTALGWIIADGGSRFLCPVPSTCWWLITLLAPRAKRLQLHLASLWGSLSQADTHSDTRHYYMNCSQPRRRTYGGKRDGGERYRILNRRWNGERWYNERQLLRFLEYILAGYTMREIMLRDRLL